MFYLFLREREGDRMSAGEEQREIERERERERGAQNLKEAPGSKLSAQSLCSGFMIS